MAEEHDDDRLMSESDKSVTDKESVSDGSASRVKELRRFRMSRGRAREDRSMARHMSQSSTTSDRYGQAASFGCVNRVLGTDDHFEISSMCRRSRMRLPMDFDLAFVTGSTQNRMSPHAISNMMHPRLQMSIEWS